MSQRTTVSPDQEEQCLFFVALSRAREHLVLSRSERYGENVLEPSPLLGLIDGQIRETKWRALAKEVGATLEPPAAHPAAEKPSYTSIQLSQYLRCPRQYYYSSIGLGSSRDLSPSEPFVRAINATLRWMHAELSALRPPSVEELFDRYQTECEKLSPADAMHKAFYEARATEVFATALKSSKDERLKPVGRADRLIARLGAADVRVDADLIAYDESGRLVIARNLLGKPQDRDHTDPLLALLRRAADDSAPSRIARIEIRYLSTGAKRVIVRSDKWEPDRVKKFETAALGIQQGQFPAAPREDGLCARCPYLFACPK